MKLTRRTGIMVLLWCLGCSAADDKPAGGSGGTTATGGRGGAGGSASGGSSGLGGASASGGTSGSGGGTGGSLSVDAPVEGARDGSADLAADAITRDVAADLGADAAVADSARDQTSAAFKLTAPWPEGGTIPAQHACAMNNWPAISWTPGPAGTASYAFALHDNNYDTHYVILDIPATVQSLPPVPAGTRIPKMGFATVNDTKWGGPCAPTGIHTYTLTVYALRTATYQGAATSAPTVRRNLEAMSNADVLGRASYTGRQGN